MYKEVFIKSWKDLKQNPILFLPDVIILVVNIILGVLFLNYSGLLKLLTDPDVIVKELEAMIPIITLFLKENLLKIILSFALFVLTSFVIGSGLVAMKMGMMKELIQEKKLTLKGMFNNGKYAFQVISMKMIMFVVGVVTFLFILGTGIILSTFIQKGLVIIVMGVFFPLFVILLQLILLFRYPIMFLENRHPITAVKESFDYLIKNKKHVFIVWVIVFAISLITVPLSSYMGFIEQKVALLSATLIVGYLLRNIMKMIVGVWSEMFKFRNYKT